MLMLKWVSQPTLPTVQCCMDGPRLEMSSSWTSQSLSCYWYGLATDVPWGVNSSRLTVLTVLSFHSEPSRGGC